MGDRFIDVFYMRFYIIPFCLVASLKMRWLRVQFLFREIIFFFLLLIIVPRFFGEPAVWWSMSIAQILAMILSAILNIKHKSVS